MRYKDEVKINISTLIGMTFTSVVREGSEYDDKILFTSSEGRKFKMFHDQDCCEGVLIEDICGELNDLVGTPILLASEESSDKDPKDGDEDFIWTFYRFSTIKGAVVIRWYGASNGYYGVDAEIVEIKDVEDSDETN